MPNVLVTGCNGYIGRHLIEKLVKDGQDDVFGLDVNTVRANGWRPFQGDLLHPDLPKLLSEVQPDIIYHAAAAPKTAPLADQLRINVIGTEHLLRALLETHLDAKVVVLGSAAEYGLQPRPVDEEAPVMPEGEYGIAKAAQTQIAQVYARRFNMPVVVGRVFNVYGETPGTLAVAAMASQIARKEQEEARGNNIVSSKIKVYNLLGRRDFIHINDVVRALLALAVHGRPGEIYNIASGEAVSLRQVLDTLIELSYLDAAKAAACIVTHGDQTDDLSEARIARIINETGWKPGIPLENGLKRELAYWREQATVLTA